jgi:hypothetical protein
MNTALRQQEPDRTPIGDSFEDFIETGTDAYNPLEHRQGRWLHLRIRLPEHYFCVPRCRREREMMIAERVPYQRVDR